MSIRRNGATWSQSQRDAYNAALKTLKNTTLPGSSLSVYDELVATHLGVTALTNGPQANVDGAHGGPAFLPWHREYILRFEEAILRVDPTLSLPYWNWGTDVHSDTDELFKDDWLGLGAYLGNKSTWPVPTNSAGSTWMSLDSGRGDTLKRNAGLSGATLTPSASKSAVDPILLLTQYNNPGGFRQSLEYGPHGPVHGWVGQHMATMTSPNDPIFFLHHAQVDHEWHKWQQNGHAGVSNYNLPNAQFVGQGHGPNDNMWPWDAGASEPNAALKALLPTYETDDVVKPKDVVNSQDMGTYYDTDTEVVATPRRSDVAVDLTIRNNGPMNLAIYWINFDGGLNKYAVLETGDSYKQGTYEGHKWIAMVGPRVVATHTAGASAETWSVSYQARGLMDNLMPSPGSSDSLSLTFKNDLSVPVEIEWLDFHGSFKRYNTLEAGDSYTQQSFVGHTWAARVNGFTVSTYMVSPTQTTWTVELMSELVPA